MLAERQRCCDGGAIRARTRWRNATPGLAPRTARPVMCGGLGLKSEFYCIRNPVCFRLRMMYGLRSGPETGRRVRGEGNWRSQVEGCASEAQVSALAAIFITGVGKKQIRKMKFQNIKKETGGVPAYYTWRDGSKSGLKYIQYFKVHGLPWTTSAHGGSRNTRCRPHGRA